VLKSSQQQQIRGIFLTFKLLLRLLLVIAVATCSSNHIDLQSQTNLVPGNKNNQKNREQNIIN
jgi:hypothetical protein